MKIIEQHRISKTGNLDDCEDIIFQNDAYIAVIDGATSKTGRLWKGKKGGLVAAECIATQLSTMPARRSAEMVMDSLNEAIMDYYTNAGVVELMRSNPIERFSASVVIFSRHKRQLWFLGDCEALIDGVHHTNTKIVDDVKSNARAMYIEGLIANGSSVDKLCKRDLGREYILPLLEMQFAFQNTKTGSDFDYGVLDGFYTDSKHIKVINLVGMPEIVLASDGYPILCHTLAKSEKKLQKILKDDPLLFRQHKSNKGMTAGNVSFDDRAYIRFNRF